MVHLAMYIKVFAEINML